MKNLRAKPDAPGAVRLHDLTRCCYCDLLLKRRDDIQRVLTDCGGGYVGYKNSHFRCWSTKKKNGEIC